MVGIIYISTVAELTTHLSSNPKTLAMLSLPPAICGHCESFKPTFEKICEENKYKFASCVYSAEIVLATKFQIEVHPGIVLFDAPLWTKFQEPRTEPALNKWLSDFDKYEVKARGEDESAAMTVFVAVNLSGQAQEDYLRAAKMLGSAQVMFVKEEGGKNGGRVDLVRQGTLVESLSGGDLGRLVNWAQRERVPFFNKVDQENFAIYEASAAEGLAFVWVCFDPKKQQGEVEKHTSTVETVSKKFRSSFNFVWIDTIAFGEEVTTQIGCDNQQFPSFVVHILGDKPAAMKRHRWVGVNNEIDVNSLERFLVRVNDNEEPLYFRNKAEVPEGEIDSSTLQMEVYKQPSLVLVSGDRQVCARCEKLKSSMTVIEGLVNDRTKLAVFVIDGLENDPPSPSLIWENVPYVFIVKREKQILFKENNPTVENLIPFLNEAFDLALNQEQFNVTAIQDEKLRARVEMALTNLQNTGSDVNENYADDGEDYGDWDDNDEEEL